MDPDLVDPLEDDLGLPADGEDWHVELLVDPTGQGRAGYAYTFGLVNYGHVELYIGPEPHSSGQPLGLPERARLLAMIAHRLVDEDLAPDQVLTEDFDDGRLVATYWLGEEEPATGVLATALPDSPTVMPVRWTARRGQLSYY